MVGQSQYRTRFSDFDRQNIPQKLITAASIDYIFPYNVVDTINRVSLKLDKWDHGRVDRTNWPAKPIRLNKYIRVLTRNMHFINKLEIAKAHTSIYKSAGTAKYMIEQRRKHESLDWVSLSWGRHSVWLRNRVKARWNEKNNICLNLIRVYMNTLIKHRIIFALHFGDGGGGMVLMRSKQIQQAIEMFCLCKCGFRLYMSWLFPVLHVECFAFAPVECEQRNRIHRRCVVDDSCFEAQNNPAIGVCIRKQCYWWQFMVKPLVLWI